MLVSILVLAADDPPGEGGTPGLVLGIAIVLGIALVLALIAFVVMRFLPSAYRRKKEPSEDDRGGAD